MDFVLASSNAGKIKEFKDLLAPFNINVLALKDIGFKNEIIENGDSFLANATIKARAVYDFCKMPVIADDSGLCVSALSGAPGIYSARYQGLPSDKLRREALLKNLENEKIRDAYFNSTIVYYDGLNIYSFNGICKGKISLEEKGTNGFGYDSIFIPNGYSLTFAEMSEEKKNNISHRAIASRKFVEFLQNDFNNK